MHTCINQFLRLRGEQGIGTADLSITNTLQQSGIVAHALQGLHGQPDLLTLTFLRSCSATSRIPMLAMQQLADLPKRIHICRQQEGNDFVERNLW